MSRVLLDTNILTAFRDWNHPRHQNVDRVLHELEESNELCVAPQSIYEFWVVATRSKDVNGLGLSPAAVVTQVEVIQNAFSIGFDPPGLLDEWLGLCRTHAVLGKNAHDARLAAYARLQGIQTLVTLNPRDFARFGLEVVVP
jgi:predicted nucleic acid-binding protein